MTTPPERASEVFTTIEALQTEITELGDIIFGLLDRRIEPAEGARNGIPLVLIQHIMQSRVILAAVQQMSRLQIILSEVAISQLSPEIREYMEQTGIFEDDFDMTMDDHMDAIVDTINDWPAADDAYTSPAFGQLRVFCPPTDGQVVDNPPGDVSQIEQSVEPDLGSDEEQPSPES